METQKIRSSVYEKTIIGIMQKLPEEQISELVDFAKFLEFQYVRNFEDDKKSIESEEKWDKLLAKPKAKRLMREMAHEALEEYRAGRIKECLKSADF